jgi:superfamily II DNA/RNA helicase
MRTKHQARKLARQLTESGVPSVDLHGNLSQPARDRNLAAFSSGEARVLVATDIAARGVHVDDVQLVVHVDPPAEHKAYLHRSGRTARAGSSGDVVTVVLPEQRRDTNELLRRAGIAVRPQQVTAASEPVADLVGEIAPYQAPAPKPVHAQPEHRSQPRRRPNRGGERAKAARSGQRAGGHGRRSSAGAGASRRSF